MMIEMDFELHTPVRDRFGDSDPLDPSLDRKDNAAIGNPNAAALFEEPIADSDLPSWINLWPV